MRITRVLPPVAFVVALGLALPSCVKKAPNQDVYEAVEPSAPGEVEATQFLGQTLTPIALQRNNALKGAQTIDRATYRLTVDGLADNPLSLSYDDLLSYPEVSKLSSLTCVIGWSFVAKWTGPPLSIILEQAKMRPEATVAIFYTTDVTGFGYTSLPTKYIQDRNIIMALKLNDVTLPKGRGFPFQVVSERKYGYKWAKWVTRIELSSDTSFRGFWERNGYAPDGDMADIVLDASAPLLQSFPVKSK